MARPAARRHGQPPPTGSRAAPHLWVVRDRGAREAPLRVVVRGDGVREVGRHRGRRGLGRRESHAGRRAAVENALHAGGWCEMLAVCSRALVASAHASLLTAMVRAVIVPGNGCNSVRSSNWYGWLEKRLLQDGRFSEVVVKDMPDPLEAKRSIWLPFMIAALGCDASTVVIGHSSGAVAAMRLLEVRLRLRARVP